MAFDIQETITPESIRNIVITLKDAYLEDDTHYQAAYFDIQIIMSDGSVKRRKGDLVPHITTAQRQALMDFMTGLRSQAEDEIL